MEKSFRPYSSLYAQSVGKLSHKGHKTAIICKFNFTFHMNLVIGIRREDLNKIGETRVAIVPEEAKRLIQQGGKILVQPGTNPETGEVKRAFPDSTYENVGGEISEDLKEADIVFGLKEIDLQYVQPGKAYLCFSHTHKGQVKNRKLLRKFSEGKNTLIDYELFIDEAKRRVLTSFTYYAGYAGMAETIWAFGQRVQKQGHIHPFKAIPKTSDVGSLSKVKEMITKVGAEISQHGTPLDLPPLICCFLGTGKTSTGAQEIFDLLPVEEIKLEELEKTFHTASRKKVYKLVLDIPDMYRLKEDSELAGHALSYEKLFSAYLQSPEHFTSNMDQVFPYVSILMNCILWSPKYPRLLSREDTQKWAQQHSTLKLIGDITCDPEGAIQFSKETWMNDPVFTYDPVTQADPMGFDGPGITVMAVTNLPCSFPADASRQFSSELSPYLDDILAADFTATSFLDAQLSETLRQATIMWKGRFTPDYRYMAAYLRE